MPSQLRDIEFIVDPENPDHIDGLRDVAARHEGAFGFPAPYGHEPVGCPEVKFNMDIVGGGVGSLCEAFRDISRFDDTGHHIHLLFDHETDALAVESRYTHELFAVTLKRAAPLWVRIPSWVDARQFSRSVDGSQIVGDYLFVPDLPVGHKLGLPYDLPTRDLLLHHRSRDIRVQVRGDSVEAMDSFGADLTFFDPLE